MTDNEALIAIEKILAVEVPNAGPTWKMVVDVCLWGKAAAKRLPKPKLSKRDYMREFMRRKRAKQRVSTSANTGPSIATDGTHNQ